MNYSYVKFQRVANGYKVIGNKKAIICNCSDLVHEQDEMIRYSHSIKVLVIITGKWYTDENILIFGVNGYLGD